MSWPYIIPLLIGVIAITTDLCGVAFAPDKFQPLHWGELAGWFAYCACFIFWGIARG